MGTKAVLPEVRIEISINAVPELDFLFQVYIVRVFNPHPKIVAKKIGYSMFSSRISILSTLSVLRVKWVYCRPRTGTVLQEAKGFIHQILSFGIINGNHKVGVIPGLCLPQTGDAQITLTVDESIMGSK
jgi:hypothetical protein